MIFYIKKWFLNLVKLGHLDNWLETNRPFGWKFGILYFATNRVVEGFFIGSEISSRRRTFTIHFLMESTFSYTLISYPSNVSFIQKSTFVYPILLILKVNWKGREGKESNKTKKFSPMDIANNGIKNLQNYNIVNL